MNEVTTYSPTQLPDTLEDLSKFVLVNEERSQALRAQIRAIKKVNLAREVYEQKLAEAQEIGDLTVEAAQKMGELLLQIQKQQGQRTDLTSPTKAEKSKTEITKEMGMTSQQVSQYQQMAQNPQAVEIAKQKARENDDIVSRSQVMKEIAEEKKRAKALEDENRRLREAVSLTGSENAILKKKLEDTPIKEVVKEIQVEVVPDDYEALKSQAKNADIYQKDFRRMQSEYEKMSEKWKQAEREKEQIIADRNKPESEKAENLKRSALFFCAGVSNFIEKYGGYVWLTQEIDNLEESEKEGYLRAVSALDAWVFQMKSNLEIQ